MSGTRRQDHDRADGYAYVRMHINFALGRVARRMKATAEAHVDEVYQRCVANGEPFDPVVIGKEAIQVAEGLYYSPEEIEAPAEEAADGAEA